MIALSMQRASLGSPAINQLRILTGCPSTAASLKLLEQGMCLSLRAETDYEGRQGVVQPGRQGGVPQASSATCKNALHSMNWVVSQQLRI